MDIKELLARYLVDYQDRAALSNVASLVINALIGIGKLILGIYLLSGWFMVTAVYYLILCVARGQALHKYTVAKGIEDPNERYEIEFNVYQRSGTFLCLLGVSYLLVSLRMYVVGDALIYRGYMVYLVAAVAFTKLGFAIYGTVANRHLKGPIVASLKIISFSDALVSIVVTQYTLLVMENSSDAISSSSWFGMGCSIVFILLGIGMLFKKKEVPAPK